MQSGTTRRAGGARLLARTTFISVRISRKLRLVLRWRTARRLPALLLALLATVAPLASRALPQGGKVQAGQATVNLTAPNAMVVNQVSDKAILDWQSFNIDAGQSVRFVQPGASAVALNRIVGSQASAIYGSLSANGQVFLVNPMGVLFAPGAQVNVGGLVATTLSLANQDFLAGRYVFGGAGPGQVVNQGQLQGNYVVLAAPQVVNAGRIDAPNGSVGLLAGSRVSIDASGAGLVKFSVDAGAVNAAIANSGTITADGGQVAVLASALSDALPTVINQAGVIRADTIARHEGTIVLSAGPGGRVDLSGSLQARAAAAGEAGGTVKVLGDRVALASTAVIDASGEGGGGTVLVGGNFHGAGPEQNATRTAVAPGALIDASAGTAGDGGHVAVWAEGQTQFAGRIVAHGGASSGNGGFVETSGRQRLAVADSARVEAAAPHGRTGDWLLDPKNIVVAATGSVSFSDVDEFADTSADSVTIGAGLLGAGSINVRLQASNDITVDAPVDFFLPGTGLTAQAGRSILVNQNITTHGGPITLVANETAANGVVSAQRDAGNAVITMAAGASLNTGNGPVSITLSSGEGNANRASGTITLNTIMTAGNVLVRNDGPLAGSGVTVGGAVSGAGITLQAANGDVTVDSAVIGSGDVAAIAKSVTLASTVQGANLLLRATTGAVMQAAGHVEAGSGSGALRVEAHDSARLTLAGNLVGALSANVTAGGFSFTNATALNVGPATIAAPGGAGGTFHDVAAIGGLSLVAAGPLQLQDSVSANNVLLRSTNNAVNEVGGHVNAGIGSGGLRVEAKNASSLASADNLVGVVSAEISNGGFTFRNGAGVNVGAVGLDAPGLAVGTTAHGVSASGDVALQAANLLQLKENVTAPNVLLRSTNDAVKEDGGQVVAGGGTGGLRVESRKPSELGSGGNQVGALSANVTVGGLRFTNAAALNVGQVSVSDPGGLGGSFHDVDAIGGVALSADGLLQLQDSVSANNVLLRSTSNAVNEVGGHVNAAIGSGGLRVEAKNASSLASADNLVGAVSADITAGGFTFRNGAGVIVGTVGLDAPGLASTDTTKHDVAASGDVALEAANLLLLREQVSAPNILLRSVSDAVQVDGGHVVAGNGTGGLRVESRKPSDLAAAANQVGAVSANVSLGGLRFTNSAALDVAAVSVSDPGGLGGSFHDVRAIGGVALVADGLLQLQDNVSANNILLKSTNNGVNEVGGHVNAGIGSGGLRVEAHDGSNLGSVENLVGVVSSDISAGGFSFRNSAGVNVGAVSLDAPGLPAGTTTHDFRAIGGVSLVADGLLQLQESVSANNVLLKSTNNAVNETGGSVNAGIGSGGLRVEAKNASSLASADNLVGVVSAEITAGGFSFRNGAGVIVGAVGLDAPGLPAGTTGHDVSANGNVALQATNLLLVRENVSGTNILLRSTSDAVKEDGGHVVAGGGAGGLRVESRKPSELGAPGNSVGALSANVTLGGFSFTASGALDVAAVGVSDPGGLGGGFHDVSAIGGVALIADGLVQLHENVSANNVLLRSTSNAVNEAGGHVNAGIGSGGLRVEAKNASSLASADNLVGSVSAEVSSGGFTFRNGAGLIVGTVGLDAPGLASTDTTKHDVTASGDVALQAANLLLLREKVSAPNILLSSLTDAVKEDGGRVVAGNGAGGLRVEAHGTSDLASADNLVGSLSGLVSSGGFTFVNSAGLAITSPTGAAGALSISASGRLTESASVQGSTVDLTASGAGSDIVLAGGVTTSGKLTLTAGGTTRITRSFGAGTLDVHGPATVSVDLVTSGAQTYDSALTLGADVTLMGTSVVLGGGVDGAGHGLTLSSDGTVRVASTTGLAALGFGGGGTLASLGTLAAARYVLDGGTVTAGLGGGSLLVRQSSVLLGAAAAQQVEVAGGTLTLGPSPGRLPGAQAVQIDAGAALDTGSAVQVLGPATAPAEVRNAGRLVVGAGLTAASITGTGALETAPGATVTTGGALTGKGTNSRFGDDTLLAAGGTIDVGGDFAGAVRIDAPASSQVSLSDTSAATPLVVSRLQARGDALVQIGGAGDVIVDAQQLAPVRVLDVAAPNGSVLFRGSESAISDGSAGVVATERLELTFATTGRLNRPDQPLYLHRRTGSLVLHGVDPRVRNYWIAGKTSLDPAARSAVDTGGVLGALDAGMATLLHESLRTDTGLAKTQNLVLAGRLADVLAPLPFRRLEVRKPRCLDAQLSGEGGC